MAIDFLRQKVRSLLDHNSCIFNKKDGFNNQMIVESKYLRRVVCSNIVGASLDRFFICFTFDRSRHTYKYGVAEILQRLLRHHDLIQQYLHLVADRSDIWFQ